MELWILHGTLVCCIDWILYGVVAHVYYPFVGSSVERTRINGVCPFLSFSCRQISSGSYGNPVQTVHTQTSSRGSQSWHWGASKEERIIRYFLAQLRRKYDPWIAQKIRPEWRLGVRSIVCLMYSSTERLARPEQNTTTRDQSLVDLSLAILGYSLAGDFYMVRSGIVRTFFCSIPGALSNPPKDKLLLVM